MFGVVCGNGQTLRCSVPDAIFGAIRQKAAFCRVSSRDGPAEHLLEARVGVLEHTVAREGDAHHGVVQDRLVLQAAAVAGADVAEHRDEIGSAAVLEQRGRDLHPQELALP